MLALLPATCPSSQIGTTQGHLHYYQPLAQRRWSRQYQWLRSKQSNWKACALNITHISFIPWHSNWATDNNIASLSGHLRLFRLASLQDLIPNPNCFPLSGTISLPTQYWSPTRPVRCHDSASLSLASLLQQARSSCPWLCILPSQHGTDTVDASLCFLWQHAGALWWSSLESASPNISSPMLPYTATFCWFRVKVCKPNFSCQYLHNWQANIGFFFKC